MTIYDDYDYKVKNEEKPKRDVVRGDLADLGTRLVALLIDGFIISVAAGILIPATGRAGGLVWFIFGVAYQWYFLTQQDGQTLGKKFMNIRVVKVDGTPLTAADVIVRCVGYFVNSILGIPLGFLWAFWDKDRQGWHDKLARTIVVRA